MLIGAAFPVNVAETWLTGPDDAFPDTKVQHGEYNCGDFYNITGWMRKYVKI